jgi:hypothetical protein
MQNEKALENKSLSRGEKGREKKPLSSLAILMACLLLLVFEK